MRLGARLLLLTFDFLVTPSPVVLQCHGPFHPSISSFSYVPHSISLLPSCAQFPKTLIFHSNIYQPHFPTTKN
ncbi:hypothetical protein BKA57DRAFT_452637 [Linnemannia elongata]|nr:hypothetical protein BKA57DRAFT_452637 [Linnemannia elongata]